MFICTICGNKYKVKPEFCDCGNDTFFEKPEEPVSRNEYIVTKRDFPIKKLLSVLFLLLCIIFSIVIFEIKPPPKNGEKIRQKPTGAVTIPDIDKIWNSTPPADKPEQTYSNDITVYERPVSKKTETSELKQNKITPVQKIIRQTPIKTDTRKTEPKTNITNTQSKPQPVNKNNQNTTRKPPVTTQSQQQTSMPARSQPEQVQTKQQTPTTTQNIVKTTQEAVTQAPTPIKTMDSQEWLNYKNSLRYALLSKLDLVTIAGEGDCAVSFSIDNNGKLLNRRFIYKSQNKSVNDGIYLMLMKLPVYKTPPANYNGETIKIKFYINNGYYEISFIN